MRGIGGMHRAQGGGRDEESTHHPQELLEAEANWELVRDIMAHWETPSRNGLGTHFRLESWKNLGVKPER